MKDSGVAWIGEIPQGWEIKRMKDCFISNSRRQPNNTVLSLSYGNVIVKDMEEKKGVTPESYDSYQGVHPGDVVLRLTDLQNDQKSLRVGRATTKGIITSAYLCVSSRTLNDRYSAYLLHDVGDIQKLFYGLGGGVRQSMKFADLAELLFSLPPLDEQLAIAAYLDRQTALIDQRLDTLAEKKTVLAELRKAIIHEAVTKGLNKNAPLKDSGVAWIGEIPQGWEVRRFKDAGSFQTGRDHKALNEGYIPVYGSSREPFAFVDRVLCKRKAIAIGRKGTVDQPFIIQAGFWAVDTCMFNIAPKKNFSLEYLGYWAEIIPWRDMSTQTALPSLTQTDANNVIVGYPPLPEQLAIADYLDRQTALIDSQLATLDEQAQVLKKLRKSIIHEAVTGKVDLSCYMPSQPQQALTV